MSSDHETPLWTNRRPSSWPTSDDVDGDGDDGVSCQAVVLIVDTTGNALFVMDDAPLAPAAENEKK